MEICIMMLASLISRLSVTSAWTFGITARQGRFLHHNSAATTTLRPIQRIFTLQSTLTTEDALDSDEIVKVPRKFTPFPFQYREEKTLRVQSLTNLGIGICRVDLPNNENNDVNTNNDHQQWVIFVPNVIPGELVRLRIFRNHNTYSEADLLQIIEPSPHRVQPPCHLADICGGCQYQHMDIDLQREWKTRQVEELLERIGNLHEMTVSPTVGTMELFHYRSKITPHYEQPTKDGPNNKYEIKEIGFKQKNSRRLVDVEYCHIATNAINERLITYREEKRDQAQANQLKNPKKGATLLLRDASEGVVTDHNVYVTTTVNGLTFRFLAGNFFQNNPFMLPVLVDHVVAAAIKPAAENGQKMTHLIDCYCGSGLFCLGASHAFQTCVGIEVNSVAIEEARANAAINGIENCAFVAASAEAIFDSNEEFVAGDNTTSTMVKDFPRESTVVVCDPPRKGCSEEFLDQLYKFKPHRIVYMSCDPATQARDANGIVASGYKITSVQPFDLFPQTRHIECLIVFELEA